MFLPKKRSHKRVKQDPVTLGGAQARKRGRPLKRPSELMPSRAAIRYEQKRLHEQLSMQVKPATQNLSSLEQLPVELIQQIFFLCLETNLANASLTLNEALSHEAIYRALLLFAYFDGHPPFPVETTLFRPAEFRYVDYDDRCRLQRGILKCRWCTLDRIEAAMPALSRLAMVQRWHEEKSLEKANLTIREGSPGAVHVPIQSISSVASLPDINDNEAMKYHFLATSDADFYQLSEHKNSSLVWRWDQGRGEGRYLPFINYWSCRQDDNGDIHKTLDGADTTLGVRHIPSWLLEGPWTEENISLLVLLRQGMRYVSCGNILDISAKALFRGMEAAMTGMDTHCPPLILTILLELWSHLFGPRSGQAREKLVASHPLPLRLFHIAIEQNPDELGFMKLLIRADLESVPNDDAIITGWAIRMRDKPRLATSMADEAKAVGTWLLHYMTYQDSGAENGYLFNNGALSWRRREGFYPFPEQSFTQELGYLCERAVNARPTAPDGSPCG